jgi:hypothetical protein
MRWMTVIVFVLIVAFAVNLFYDFMAKRNSK